MTPETMIQRLFACLLALFVLASPAHAQASPAVPAMTVHLVPIGSFSPERIDRLAAYLEKRFGLAVRKHPQVSLTKQMIDYSRRQVPAQEILDVLEARRIEWLRQERGIVIGLTSYDMYIRGLDWDFAFAAREEPALAAVSTWRMDEANLGKRSDEERLFERLKKMASKMVGALALGRPASEDPASGMFGAVRSLEDLDRMGEEF
ncbi:MAG: hypothetical protein OHK0026_13420 [Rhodocyclaceae bacterium]